MELKWELKRTIDMYTTLSQNVLSFLTSTLISILTSILTSYYTKFIEVPYNKSTVFALTKQ